MAKILFDKRKPIKFFDKRNTPKKLVWRNAERDERASDMVSPSMVLSKDSSLDSLVLREEFGTQDTTPRYSESDGDYRLKEGEEISADFGGKVVDVLGSGAFGKVYLVESEITLDDEGKSKLYKSYSAVKVINDDVKGEDRVKAVNDLKKEAAVTSSFGGYTYVVNARLLKRNNKVIGAVYDHVDGPSLDKFLTAHIESGLLPPVEISLSLGERILRVLDVSQNEYGLAHKDISLDNCMLHTKSGTPRVIDWGTAHNSYNNIPSGKLSNMAPEILNWFIFHKKRNLIPNEMVEQMPQLNFETYCKADMFSFGIIMNELLAGTTPLKIPEKMSVLNSMIYRFLNYKGKNLQNLDSICNDLPQSVSDSIAGCLRENPDSRPNSMEALQSFNYLLHGNGQMGFGTTDRTHAKYWQAFLEGKDYDFDPELVKLLKAKLRKRCFEEHGANAKIDEHYDAKNEVPTMYRTFEEAFGLDACQNAVRNYLIEEYERTKLKSMSSCEESLRERIGNKFDSEIQKAKGASYGELSAILAETSRINYLHNKVAERLKNPKALQEQINSLREQITTESDFEARAEIYNNRHRYAIIKDFLIK